MSERPIECSGCKCQIKVVYTEIDKDSKTSMEMCESCPVLKEKLSGKTKASLKQELCCATCQTTLESFVLSGSLGCPKCYEAFEEAIVDKLKYEGFLSFLNPDISPSTIPKTFYLGKNPSEDARALSSALSDLNDALSEALKNENFEKAATLRDQINQTVEGLDGKNTAS